MNLPASPIVVATVSFLVAAGFTSGLVPLVRHLGLHFGFTDQPDARKQHSTPIVRVGGIAMVSGFVLSLSAIWLLGGFGLLAPERDQLIWSTLAGSLCFFLIGLADDLYALSPWPRLAGQIFVAAAIWSQGVRIGAIDLPWLSSTGLAIQLSDGLSLLATVIWLVGITNAINWLDGLDGLAIMPTVMVATGLGVIAYLAGNVEFAEYLNIAYLPGAGELMVFCGAIAGAGLGFLWFNTYPAMIFMGDVGALALGAALGIVAVMTRHEIVLFIMGGIFVLETVSVIIQVGSFKLTGKRVFRMAPIHHHFELKGWPEPRVIVRFWIITVMLVLFGLATLKLR